jgi:TPR repeat protein
VSLRIRFVGLGCLFLVLCLRDAGAMAGELEDARAAAKRRDYATALSLWERLARNGDRAAQNDLGVLYRNGLGVTKDLARAADWFRSAAEQGDAKAQFSLGALYEYGWEGVSADRREAVRWMEKAAEQGHAMARARLQQLEGKPLQRAAGVVESDPPPSDGLTERSEREPTGSPPQRAAKEAVPRRKGVSADELTDAAWRGQLDRVRALIQLGLDADARDANGDTALARAASRGHAAIIEVLLAHGAQIDAPLPDDMSPIMLAAREGRDDTLETLIAHGADVRRSQRNGATALGWAAV